MRYTVTLQLRGSEPCVHHFVNRRRAIRCAQRKQLGGWARDEITIEGPEGVIPFVEMNSFQLFVVNVTMGIRYLLS